MSGTKQEDEPDLLYGVPAIAAFLGMREKQCRYRIEAKIIPTFRLAGGVTICSRRTVLTAWLNEQMPAGGKAD